MLRRCNMDITWISIHSDDDDDDEVIPNFVHDMYY